MHGSRARFIVPAALLIVLATTAFRGGWAVITLESLPEYLVAERPTTFTFYIRQHGVTLADMDASLTATDGNGLSADALVTRTGQPGEYRANLSVPAPGDWTIRIRGELGDSTLLAIPAVRTQDPAPAPLSDVVRGERLFVAKGCISCHVNKDIEGMNSVRVGPELTGKTYPADFLKRLLADPAGTLGGTNEDSFVMPNLNLSRTEIEAITAFVNREKPVEAALVGQRAP